MALLVNGSTHLIPAYHSFYRPRKDERLSWPSWLTYSGWLTHISGHPSAAGRAQDRESSPARDQRSTTVPRHQLNCELLKRENGCMRVLVQVENCEDFFQTKPVLHTDASRTGKENQSIINYVFLQWTK